MGEKITPRDIYLQVAEKNNQLTTVMDQRINAGARAVDFSEKAKDTFIYSKDCGWFGMKCSAKSKNAFAEATKFAKQEETLRKEAQELINQAEKIENEPLVRQSAIAFQERKI